MRTEKGKNPKPRKIIQNLSQCPLKKRETNQPRLKPELKYKNFLFSISELKRSVKIRKTNLFSKNFLINIGITYYFTPKKYL